MALADQQWFSRKEAARYLTALGCRVTFRMLNEWAVRENEGKGPAFYKDGLKRVIYSREDLDNWRSTRLRRVA